MTKLKISPSLDLNKRLAAQIFLKGSPNITVNPLANNSNILIDGDISQGNEIVVSDSVKSSNTDKVLQNSHDDWVNSSPISGTVWTRTISGTDSTDKLPTWNTYSLPYAVNTTTGLDYSEATNETVTLDADSGDITITVTGPARASSFMSAPGIMLNAETMTVGGVQYTFQTTLTNTANNVLIGANEATTLANFKTAINRTAGAGTLYAEDTVIHPTITATTITATTLVVQAKRFDTIGNALNLLEGTTNWTVDNATLENGTGVRALQTLTLTDVMNEGDIVTIGPRIYTMSLTVNSTSLPNTILIGASSTLTSDNIMNAINGGFANGVTVSFNTPVNDQVDATSPTNTVIISSRNTSNVSDAIQTLEDSSEASWAAGVLASGAGTDNRYKGVTIVQR